jgi:hypothetical protein
VLILNELWERGSYKKVIGRGGLILRELEGLPGGGA